MLTSEQKTVDASIYAAKKISYRTKTHEPLTEKSEITASWFNYHQAKSLSYNSTTSTAL